jgi:signal transduction histidine kinase
MIPIASGRAGSDSGNSSRSVCALSEIKLTRVPTDLPRLVLEVTDAYRAMGAAKRVALHFSADEAALRAPQASVDPIRFRQIVENLVGNAVKYSPVAKNVWTSVTHSPDTGYRVVVRDEGQGLTAEDKAKLFGKFQQLSARPTAGEVSTGLGLAIVKRLVDLHGGRVWAESEGRGLGTQFIVTIP